MMNPDGTLADLKMLADQFRMIDQMSELAKISKQVEEWNQLASIKRGTFFGGRSALLLKCEYDRLLERISQLWSAVRLPATVRLTPWVFYHLSDLRRRASCPMMRFMVSLRQALAHSIPATFDACGKRTRQLLVAHPPIAPPFAA
ncbi:hypothetical protein HUX88_23290 [Duganella sp. BJB1802]|uniref:hypothetical protein n=1 Tax=Duganella sp. BJB1802 TaxID=2744575 RepID=UPI001594939C|nr:hypothetical protein [Duganella sp. BJB1802]NVD73439.1 hypothetical protein [Duganella sp. BJB1802]